MNMSLPHGWILPDWPAPPAVRAVSTTRRGGVSRGPWASMNLAMHVGDAAEDVATNRSRLQQQLGLAAAPVWLEQVHGTGVCDLDRPHADTPRADGAIATRAGRICAVMTADCLPVLLAARDGSCVAAVHAGWRGLAGGVIEAALARMPGPAEGLMAWLGPAIGPQAFEVGEEVRAAFVDHDPQAAAAFQYREGAIHADLYHLARLRLQAHGVTAIHGGGRCTCSEREEFYSYRRDGTTGRMASLIWLDS